MPEKIRKNIYYVLIYALIILGVGLRILFYAYGRPFWNDEAALAINLVDRSFWELFLPLSHEQVTPPLYSVLCKLCSFFISKEEFAFRLPALLCGIFSLPVFYFFSKKILQNRLAIVFSVAIFALNYQLIYYSQELKQYSCDVLVFLTVLLSYFYIEEKNLSQKKLILVGVFYALCIWLSYTSLFAMFFVFALCCVKKTKSLTLFSLPVISFAIFLFFIKKFATDDALHNFWNDGFIAKDFSNFANLVYNNIVFYFPDFSWKLIIVLMFLAGFIFILKNIRQKQNLLLFLPVALAVLLSYFCIYPMYIRTALYLLPIVFLIMAKAFDFDFGNKMQGLVLFGVLTIIFTIYSFKTDFVQILQKKYYRETTPNLLLLYTKQAKNNEALIIPKLSAINFEYYSKRFNFENKNIILIKKELYEYDEVKTVYDMLPKGFYYLMLTHSGDKKLEFESLKKYAEQQRNFKIINDEFDNALIMFEK